jgi:hypothetical protein
MITYWQVNHPKRPYFLALSDIAISKVTFDDLSRYAKKLELDAGKLPAKSFSIPIAYMSKVTAREEDETVIVHFNKESKERYVINDGGTRTAFLSELSKHPRVKKVIIETPDVFTTIKKPLIALLILGVLSAWAFFNAVQLERGEGVESLAIVLLLASLGSLNVLLVFAGITATCGGRIWYNLRDRREETVVRFR